MDNPNGYVLVCDDCNDCRYITNAFTFLRLPLTKVSTRELFANPDMIANSIAVILCKQAEDAHDKKLYQLLNGSTTGLISLKPVTVKNAYSDKPVQYLQMPFSKSELVSALSQCANYDNHFEDTSLTANPIFEKLMGNSKQICEIRSLIKQVAFSDSTVLILGQSGTGKDVIASCIHYLSNRKDKPLVPINCGAIPSELMESELFGHEKGAFTGALTRRAGRFEIADTGTLFLDEIGDMPLPMQVKLLRVIQERKIDRVGGNASIKVDVRLIAATNKHLEELIHEGRFREDLFYRLNVFPIRVPSLHERAEDIPLLIDYHVDKIQDRLKHRVEFTDSAKQVLCEYPWPGNIRELENFLERMVILHRERILDVKDLDQQYTQKKSTPSAEIISTQPTDAQVNIKDYIAKIEQQMIQVALDKSNGVISAAAEYLSLGRTTLIEKMKKYNLVNAKS